MDQIKLSDREFAQFQRFIYEAAGITLSASKRALVCGRLARRLQQHGLASYGAYFQLLERDAGAETQIAVDLLTTNETYFFREPRHFAFLRQQASGAARQPAAPFRVWSAASASGEEAYSIAMVLADCLGPAAWEVLGSDISTRVLERARAGRYPIDGATHIPAAYLQRYCRKGVALEQGFLLIERALRARVRFMQVNLNRELPRLGQFDIIFLRNVMIYFGADTKRQVVTRVLTMLKPGGHLCIGHAENLNEMSDQLSALAPAIYRKV